MPHRLSTRFFLALLLLATSLPAAAQDEVAIHETRNISQNAYVYGFPLVDNYRVLYSFAVDPKSKEYKAPFNQIKNEGRVFTPADTTVQTPNSDTPYSFAALDLRAEPIVLTLPPVEKNRYYAVQLVDLYTYNFGYLGTRATGNGGGSFLIAGPDWKGEAPKGVSKVIRADTQLALALYRTQLFDAADIENVRKIQAGYLVQPLSKFLGKPAPPPAPKLDFVAPLTPPEQRTSGRFFEVLGFVLGLSPVLPEEAELRARFAKLGIQPGFAFDPAKFPPQLRAAMGAGMRDGQKEIDALRAVTRTSSGLFGDRKFLGDDYVKRALAAQTGIYGNSKEEAFYVVYRVDASGKPLDASKQGYAIRFAKDALPPAQAFWSMTMYRLPQQLLVDNPLDRYLINSPMLPALARDADGGLTLVLQSDSPGKAQEANWLPAPKGPFFAVLRIYLPKPEVLDGKWKAPALEARGD